MIAKDGDQARRAAQRRELDERRVVMHERFEILSAFGNHPVKLARKDRRVSGDNLLALSME